MMGFFLLMFQQHCSHKLSLRHFFVAAAPVVSATSLPRRAVVFQ